MPWKELLHHEWPLIRRYGLGNTQSEAFDEGLTLIVGIFIEGPGWTKGHSGVFDKLFDKADTRLLTTTPPVHMTGDGARAYWITILCEHFR